MGRKIWQVSLSMFLVIQLAAGGGTALPEGASTIGHVIAASKTSLGEVPLPGDGTLLDNDLLRTAKGGKALVDFPDKVRAAIAEETNVRFRNAGGRLVADLDSGTVIAQQETPVALQVETPKYSVAPQVNGRGLYLVAVLADQSTIVAARFGSVVITKRDSGERYVLHQGSYASIAASAAGVPAAPGQEKEESRQAPGKASGPAPGPPPPEPGWHIGSLSPGASAALIAAIAGGGGAVALGLSMSGEKSVSPTQ